MRFLFPRVTSLFQVTPFEWRVSALILMAALSSASQGCGIISDAPNRPSTKNILPPDPRTADPSIDLPQTHIIPREIPSIDVLPSYPEPEESATLAKIPELREPTIVETGLASWYGPRFHGNRTASGEIFNQHDFTAAHRTLPWGSKVKVTNTANGKSVEVRINDRGPFGKGRIIDLSRAAARVLGMVGSGITTVRIEWLSDSEKANELVLQD
jgi:rare lipoprotein A